MIIDILQLETSRSVLLKTCIGKEKRLQTFQKKKKYLIGGKNALNELERHLIGRKQKARAVAIDA